MKKFNFISLAFLLLAAGFCIVGCGKFYDAAGIEPITIKEFVAEDSENMKVIVKEVRDTFWEFATAGVSILGAAVSGYLGVKLRDSNKINVAMIRGIEKTPDKNVKGNVAAEANAMHIEDKLHAKVKHVTG